MRKAKNEEWAQLGRDLEKDAVIMQLVINQRKLWKRVNEGKREKGGPVHLSGKDGQRLTDQTDTMDR